MKIIGLCTHDIITKWTHIYKKSQWRLFDEDIEYRDDSEHDEDDEEQYDDDTVKKQIMDMLNGLPIVQKANNDITEYDVCWPLLWPHSAFTSKMALCSRAALEQHR